MDNRSSLSQDKQFTDFEKTHLTLAEKKGFGHIEISYFSNM